MTIMQSIVPNTEELVQGSAILITLTADTEDRKAVETYGQRLVSGERITGELMRAFIPAIGRALRNTRYPDLVRHLNDVERSFVEDAIAIAVYRTAQEKAAGAA